MCECKIKLSRAHVPCQRVGASFLINNNNNVPHELRGCCAHSHHAHHLHALHLKPRGFPEGFVKLELVLTCEWLVLHALSMARGCEKWSNLSKSSVSLSSVLDGSGLGLIPTTVFFVGPTFESLKPFFYKP